MACSIGNEGNTEEGNGFNYLHIKICELHYILLQVFNEWAVIADKHNLCHQILIKHKITACILSKMKQYHNFSFKGKPLWEIF